MLEKETAVLTDDTAARIRDFVLKKLQAKASLPSGVNLADFDYIDAGYVDSMALISFVVEIESTFDIVLGDDDIISPDFRTVEGLVRLIAGKLG